MQTNHEVIPFRKNNASFTKWYNILIKGSIVGELGYYLNMPRTASVIFEQQTTVYKITEENLKNILLRYPDQVVLFQNYLIYMLANKLNNANKTIQTLV